MGAQSHDFPAKSDAWIAAAGFDPATHPEFVSIREWVGQLSQADNDYARAQRDFFDSLVDEGFADLQRHYTLDERFGLYGIDIASKEGGEWSGCYGDYEPTVIKLSNGLTLREVRDEAAEEARWADPNNGYQEGYDFVFCYKVEVVSEAGL